MRLTLLTLAAVMSFPVFSLAGVFDQRPTLPPDRYGDVLIDRTATAHKVQPVVFSHWLHRRHYTCRVCHGELDFAMKRNASEITEAANLSGKFCGACHNGDSAFPHAGNCDRCHGGDRVAARVRYDTFKALSLPLSKYGNGVDWVEALRRGVIRPASYLKTRANDIPFDRVLTLASEERDIIAPASFPHKAHVEWLECGSCHPELFMIKKKATADLNMGTILRGQYCSVCHLSVAFPMDDCQRCHPRLKEKES